MRARCFAILLALSALRCEPATDPREARVLSTLVRADYAAMRSRPALMAAKFARMRAREYDFYRGTYPVFVRDALEGDPRAATRFAPSALVAGLGDAHPENAGVLVGADGALGLEFNDFDAADRVPYAWDLRRLATGLCVAARGSNEGDPAARDALVSASPAVARAAVQGYLDALRSYAAGAERQRVVAPTGAANIDDLFRRGARDLAARAELDELTTLQGATRTLLRGVPDPASPDTAYAGVSATVREALSSTLARYAARLSVAREPGYFTLLDAVRQYGSGVASLPRVRLLALVRGPTDRADDDVILEVKELADSGAPASVPPFVWADTVAERVRSSAYAAWGGADREPLWSTDTLLGVAVQIRRESEAHKSLRVARMTEALGTPAALEATARVLGALLARVHMSTDDGARSASAVLAAVALESDEAFVREHVDASLSYAAQVAADWTAFDRALGERGPLLGWIADPEDGALVDAWAQLLVTSEGVR